MRSFSLYPILQSLCATSCHCIGGFQKSSQLAASVRPGCCVKAARFLISCLSGAGRYRSIIILSFVTNAFSIQTIRASVLRSPYRNPVRLPFIFKKLERLERCARIILAGDSQCFWFFCVFGSVTRWWFSSI